MKGAKSRNVTSQYCCCSCDNLLGQSTNHHSFQKSTRQSTDPATDQPIHQIIHSLNHACTHPYWCKIDIPEYEEEVQQSKLPDQVFFQLCLKQKQPFQEREHRQELCEKVSYTVEDSYA